MTTIEFTSLIP